MLNFRRKTIIKPKFHVHTGSTAGGGCYTVNTGRKSHGPLTPNKVYGNVGNGQMQWVTYWDCTWCNRRVGTDNPGCRVVYALGCGKNTNTIDAYTTNCNLTQGEILGATIAFKDGFVYDGSGSSAESGAGYSEGYAEGYDIGYAGGSSDGYTQAIDDVITNAGDGLLAQVISLSMRYSFSHYGFAGTDSNGDPTFTDQGVEINCWTGSAQDTLDSRVYAAFTTPVSILGTYHTNTPFKIFDATVGGLTSALYKVEIVRDGYVYDRIADKILAVTQGQLLPDYTNVTDGSEIYVWLMDK